MEKFQSVNDILFFAINAEQEAVDFYNGLSGNAKTSEMREVFAEFAREEMSHKARLLKIMETGISDLPDEKVTDLKMADYVVTDKAGPDMTYENALVVAMKKEKAAFRLYSALVDKVSSPEMKSLFRSLAMEESRHKLRFEIEYDEYVLRDN